MKGREGGGQVILIYSHTIVWICKKGNRREMKWKMLEVGGAMNGK
jgi:hypothetical protein